MIKWCICDYFRRHLVHFSIEILVNRIKFFWNDWLFFIEIVNPTPPASAFTYPYGRLTTFELDYGPKGWFLKYLFGSSNMTATRFLQTTTSQYPVVKWNSTWRYFRRPRPRIFTTKTTTTTISTTVSTTTTLSKYFRLKWIHRKAYAKCLISSIYYHVNIDHSNY